MIGVVPSRQRDLYHLSDELRELYGQQFDAIQRDAGEVELEDYKERQERVHQLQIELRAKVHRPS